MSIQTDKKIGAGLLRTLVSCAALAMAAACSTTVADDQTASSDNSSRAAGIDMRAEKPVMLTSEPLGDVVVGRLAPGDAIRATCIEAAAQTNAGFQGSAVRVESDGLSGFAATTTFPADGGAGAATFDASAEELATQLDPC